MGFTNMSFDRAADNRFCYVIAEAGLNHNGSLELAKELIDVAATAGADAVKFQKRTVDHLAIRETLDAPDDRFPQFGSTYRQIREHLEFDFEEYVVLKSYAEKKNLDFICTAFDPLALDFLDDLGVDLIKLASHSLTNIELLRYVADKRKSTILSTGMSSLSEIETAVNIFKEAGTDLLLLHCVSSYPTKAHESNLNMITTLRNHFALPVGYSGHELGFFPTTIAVAMGAVVVERHFTLDKAMVGFDHKMSLDPGELAEMVREIREIEVIKGDGVKLVSDTEKITKSKYHVSIVSARFISKGSILTEEMVTYRNPGTGIPPKHLHKILGQKAKCDIEPDQLMQLSMFD